MTITDEEAKGDKATDKAELKRQIMDPNEPKNEREWWAYHEIGHMRELLGKSAHLLDQVVEPEWGHDKRERQQASMLCDDIKRALGVKKEDANADPASN